MSGKQDEIMELVVSSIIDIAKEWDINLTSPILRETGILGEGLALDSMALVNIIVRIEEKIVEHYNKPITIANEMAFSRKKSPFRTVGSLTDYIITLLFDSEHG